MISKYRFRNFIIALGNSANKLKEGELESLSSLHSIKENKRENSPQNSQINLSEEELRKEIRKYENEIRKLIKNLRPDLRFYAEHRINSIKIEKNARVIQEKLKRLYEDVLSKKEKEDERITLENKFLINQKNKKIKELKEILKNIEKQYSIISKKLSKKQRERIEKRIKRLKTKINLLLKKEE